MVWRYGRAGNALIRFDLESLEIQAVDSAQFYSGSLPKKVEDPDRDIIKYLNGDIPGDVRSDATLIQDSDEAKLELTFALVVEGNQEVNEAALDLRIDKSLKDQQGVLGWALDLVRVNGELQEAETFHKASIEELEQQLDHLVEVKRRHDELMLSRFVAVLDARNGQTPQVKSEVTDGSFVSSKRDPLGDIDMAGEDDVGEITQVPVRSDDDEALGGSVAETTDDSATASE